MNDDQKTKEQLLEELVQGRALLEQAEERSLALQEVSNRVAAAHDTDEVLDLIVNEATRLVGATGAFIRILDGNKLVARAWSKFARFTPANSPELGVGEGSLAGHVFATMKPLFGEEVARVISSETRRTFEEIGIDLAATGSVPLLANNQCIGTLSLGGEQGRRFTEDEVSLLTAFADQASLALEKARLLNEAKREKERSDALYRISNQLAGVHDTDQVLKLIVEETARLVGAPFVILRMMEDGVMVPRGATDAAAAYAFEAIQALKVEEGTSLSGAMATQAMATQKPLLADEIKQLISQETRQHLLDDGFSPTAVIPLLANDRSIGTLSVAEYRHRIYTEDEVSLLMAFADQAALALEKARLLNEAETEKERAETERERADSLYRVSNLLAGAHDTDEVLDLIVNEATRLVDAHGAFIRMLEGDLLVPGAATESASAFLAKLDEDNPAMEVGMGANGRAMASKKPLVGEEIFSLRTPEVERITREMGVCGVASIPLVANDRSIGVLAVVDTYQRLISDDELSLLTAFADQASLALEKARLLNEAEREKERSDALYQVSNRLAGVHETDEVLDLIVNEAARLLSAPGAFLRLLEGDFLVAKAATESAGGFSAANNPAFIAGAGIMGHVLSTKKPLVVEDVQTHEMTTPSGRLNVQKAGFHGSAYVPLLANGHAIGVLSVADTRIRSFSEDEVSLLMAFADQASLALEKARLLNEAETRERQATQLYEVTTQLASNHDLGSVLDMITAKAVDLLGCEASGIFEYSLVKDELSIARTFNFPPELQESVTFKPGEGIAGLAFQEQRPVWTSDRQSDSSYVEVDPISWTGLGQC